MKIKIKNVRLAFPELFAPKAVNDGAPAYSATFLFAPDHPDVAKIKELVKGVATEKWGAKVAEVMKGINANQRNVIKDGATKADYAGYEGNLFINARNANRPEVRDRDASPLQPGDGKPYSGCYVDAVLDIWAQDNKYGKRINASLLGVQFRKDGEAFSGGAKASDDDFETMDEDEFDDDVPF